MNETEVRKRLESLVAEVFELSPEDLPISDELNIEYLGDSLQHLELCALIERHCGVSLGNEDIRSFANLVRLVNAHSSTREA